MRTPGFRQGMFKGTADGTCNDISRMPERAFFHEVFAVCSTLVTMLGKASGAASCRKLLHPICSVVCTHSVHTSCSVLPNMIQDAQRSFCFRSAAFFPRALLPFVVDLQITLALLCPQCTVHCTISSPTLCSTVHAVLHCTVLHCTGQYCTVALHESLLLAPRAAHGVLPAVHVTIPNLPFPTVTILVSPVTILLPTVTPPCVRAPPFTLWFLVTLRAPPTLTLTLTFTLRGLPCLSSAGSARALSPSGVPRVSRLSSGSFSSLVPPESRPKGPNASPDTSLSPSPLPPPLLPTDPPLLPPILPHPPSSPPHSPPPLHSSAPHSPPPSPLPPLAPGRKRSLWPPLRAQQRSSEARCGGSLLPAPSSPRPLPAAAAVRSPPAAAPTAAPGIKVGTHTRTQTVCLCTEIHCMVMVTHCIGSAAASARSPPAAAPTAAARIPGGRKAHTDTLKPPGSAAR